MQYVISALLVLTFMAQGAKRAEQDVFSSLPPQQQSQLVQRLGLYLSYERHQDYGRLYDLLSNETKNPKFLKQIGGITPLQSKVEYIKYRKSAYPKVLGFVPLSCKGMNDGRYEIRGQARLRYKGGVAKRERILYAWLRDDVWVFSELNEELID
jgi:hypothetical protein